MDGTRACYCTVQSRPIAVPRTGPESPVHDDERKLVCNLGVFLRWAVAQPARSKRLPGIAVMMVTHTPFDRTATQCFSFPPSSLERTAAASSSLSALQMHREWIILSGRPFPSDCHP